ncbi:beta-ketoacyl-[acyl-carrier-protein] synthase family protein [Pseudomonas extremaustralis]|jgi:3-oxoacyl-[acyl-carrier-protein] synthase I|uniref:3-oxoacyl-[acyl-carrier-protein] synthase-1 n=1 Tax=Pseudomonas extremaustralis TaxID=359110 RepID=A0A5C5QN81_9PSED|nr:beta-ketoacyl-[acyl-carrier-protein] synthase family protein [Pseudomonas extremaustralis]EZI29712.1 3-oxoacyl-ACP synthase [Pseudomonas extremaustralis 14-3 substr. 14-3b]MDF3131951.1 beta-ketoacyl-[acyl-carrier-protein] synthase family protein [Pseudomonas extremaustralis]TWS06925.1 beta-ketoacyl-[acyl-carrier-protein] synthase family protein [Pseudomonas extremaustralis]SDF85668.1 3-oxoacyl-[acyl-carrier-protein] synthase-1 [Pseudomonas extremaustralis]SKA77922.1 3-oxoacyl-[acyl-carrier-
MTAYLNALGVICALGRGQEAVSRHLFAGDCSGMRGESGWVPERVLPVGGVHGELAIIPPELGQQSSRNNQLLLEAALQIEGEIRQAILTYGPSRVGIVLGTSTSGIDEASRGIAHYLRDKRFPGDYDYQQQELSAPANFLADWLQLSGPAYVISTACTSSARALMSARRLLDLGVCDAVICGGVDSLCKLTLNGFSALEAVSNERCNPFSVNRNGINIGEAAVLFLMTREPAPIALLGSGASCDAHHISAPEPSGKGALQAMHKALASAKLQPGQIGYLNLHGTATQHNDAMESLAVASLFPQGVPCSSTKPMSGHTLGAAGALEAAFCWLSLAHGRLPPHVWDGQADPALPALRWAQAGELLEKRCLMSNSFAFGGNNVSLIIAEAP